MGHKKKPEFRFIHEDSHAGLQQQACHNSPISHSARHQRPARETHKIRIASQENVDNQMLCNTNFTH